VRSARQPLLGDRRAWPLVHHDSNLPELADRIASLKQSAAGPKVTLRFDGADWAPVGVARCETDASEWLGSEEDDIRRP
jgi:hypothetical protein